MFQLVRIHLGSWNYSSVCIMALLEVPGLLFKAKFPFGNDSKARILPSKSKRIIIVNPSTIQAKANTRTESAKTINRRMRKKFTGTPTKPRLSVFCSDRQLYAVLVDDQNKQCLFYGSTLQKSIRDTPLCNTIEAARRVGEKLVAACVDLNIQEISAYDRNGYASGEKMQAFEIAISQYGFLPR